MARKPHLASQESQSSSVQSKYTAYSAGSFSSSYSNISAKDMHRKLKLSKKMRRALRILERARRRGELAANQEDHARKSQFLDEAEAEGELDEEL